MCSSVSVSFLKVFTKAWVCNHKFGCTWKRMFPFQKHFYTCVLKICANMWFVLKACVNSVCPFWKYLWKCARRVLKCLQSLHSFDVGRMKKKNLFQLFTHVMALLWGSVREESRKQSLLDPTSRPPPLYVIPTLSTGERLESLHTRGR